MPIARHRLVAVLVALVSVACAASPSEAAHYRHPARARHHAAMRAEYGHHYAAAPHRHHHRVALVRGRADPMG